MHPWFPGILCALALIACAPLAHAQIYHCIGAHGEPVFSGQPCGTPVTTNQGGSFTKGGSGALCAASPQQLRDAVAGAFLTHDVNQLAGLIVWRGIGQASARTTLQALSKWLQQPLTGISLAHSGDPPLPDGDPAPAYSTRNQPDIADLATQTPTGLAVSTGGVAGSTRYFGLTESEGCWWLTF